ncbi:MAG: dTDP-4-dehydrorhamnose reductase [Bacteroidales bacterium]
MKILVTGSNGQLGKSIQDRVKNFPEHTFIFTDIEELDITSETDLDQFFLINKINVLINCAAYTAVDKAEEDQKLAYRINRDAVKLLAVFSMKYMFSLIHISTDYVFSGKNFRPYIETDLAEPNGVYGKSKYEGEQAIFEFSNRAVIIRTSWLYSEYGQNFVKTILRLGNEREELKIVSDQVGSPTYGGDLADAILHIIVGGYKFNKVELFHFSNEGIASWYDFALDIMKQSSISCRVFPIKTEDYPLPAPRPFYSVLSKEKFTKTFNYTIPYWKNSLLKCLERIDKS